MDLYKTIAELHGELAKLDRVIAALEELQRVHHSAEGLAIQSGKRGRKSMSAEERRDVSERMRKYWVNRHRASRLSSK
jgi:hypothetical protein